MRTRENYPISVQLVVLLWAWFLFPPASAPGQGYPEKPITIYCGCAAGASTDLAARSLAEGAEKILGVPVVVENKAGGSAPRGRS